MARGDENVFPPSVETDSAITWFASSCHATCTSPFAVTYGSAPIPPVLPVNGPLTFVGVENVAPPSSE
jgi:hypothetical protein